MFETTNYIILISVNLLVTEYLHTCIHATVNNFPVNVNTVNVSLEIENVLCIFNYICASESLKICIDRLF